MFLRLKDSFAKFQNITKGTVDATLEYLLCGFIRHFKIKHMFCVKTSNAMGGGFELQLLNSLIQNR